MWFAIFSTLLGLMAPIIILETTLRFLPVNEGLRVLPVNQTNPILRFTPNRTSVWSRGWDFSLVNRVRTNNYGFVSNIDYDPVAGSPLLAIIGDSYIEAAMIPYDQTGAARLAERLRGVARVYSFGSSGSSLSQYLAYAEYARDIFHPDSLVILVVGNDFDESLLKYKNAPGFYYFIENGDHKLVLKRVDLEVTPLRKLVRASALGMYLTTNLNIEHTLTRLIGNEASRAEQGTSFVGDTAANADPTRVADSQRAVDEFLRILPEMSGLDPTKIVLAVDGIRPNLYDSSLESAQGSYFDVMRRYFMAGAKAKGFEVIDLQQEFIDHYKKHGQQFEFPNDDHWNAVGHEVFADAVARSALYLRFSSLKR
ncbi:MAG TPA: hypothetical protein VLQ90_10035 [Pyrinomonadaceae bacterium]|nr:hypothetical protein [Pyrinomonadaceae bacterium]